MRTIIHVNQHNIKHNRKHEEKKPVLTCKTYKANTKADRAVIYAEDGSIAAQVIYSPDKPLPCGAHVWIETTNRVEAV